jgi:protein O-GlcNAc transferase
MASTVDEATAGSEGMMLLQAGKLRDAELSFRNLLLRNPRDINATYGLGIVAHQTGHFAWAIELFNRALALQPDFPGALVNRGITLVALGKFGEAVESFERALVQSPGLVSAWVNMATALHALGRLDEAVAALERTDLAEPGNPEVLNNLGNLYKDQGRLTDAVACYERALQFNPMQPQAFSNMLSATKLDSSLSPAEILRKHRGWSGWFEAVSAAAPLLTHLADPERVLRIGYVSPDCHTALPAFIDPVIAAHDRKRFAVFCYFNNPQRPEKLRELGVAETHRVLRGLDDERVAKLIHDDRIDILVDIAGHTGHNRLGVFARKPSPVQITWLDYLCTTGLEAMDYRLTDWIADPPGNDAFHSEKLLRMPHSQWCWRPDAAAPPVTGLPALRNSFITFGSFNNAQKLTDATLALWRDLLMARPDARLRIAGIPEGFARDRVRRKLGCEPARVDFLPRVGLDEYRRSFGEVDIALDPLPFSGATTTLDALWQGVPVLTLPGQTSCSRSTASMLSELGLTDWVAADAVDFLQRMRQLAGDIDALAELRTSLRARITESALVDTSRFIADFEAQLRGAWRTWCDARIAAGGNPHIAAGIDIATQRALDDLSAGRIDTAMTALRAVLDVRPQWELVRYEFAWAGLTWAKLHPECKPAWAMPVAVPPRQSVSAVICSIRPDYFNAIGEKLAAQFAGHDFEVIGIHDAKSLCEGYNRGAMQAKGERLIFCHDDIDTVHADFGVRVLHHLATHDIIGVVGASRVVNGDWAHAGPPHTHGQIIHQPPGESGYIYLGVGLQAPVVEGICALDGVFVATHRRVWEAIRFDEQCFDGFHLYDIDFTYRAHRAGFRLAVPLDLLLIHYSTGRYDMRWQAVNRRFLEKFAELSNQPSSKRYAYLHVKLKHLEQVERLHTALLHHRFGAIESVDSAMAEHCRHPDQPR